MDIVQAYEFNGYPNKATWQYMHTLNNFPAYYTSVKDLCFGQYSNHEKVRQALWWVLEFQCNNPNENPIKSEMAKHLLSEVDLDYLAELMSEDLMEDYG